MIEDTHKSPGNNVSRKKIKNIDGGENNPKCTK